MAYSRGVQAFLLCLKDSAPDWLRKVGNVYLIGGCLWQRQEPALPERVLRGLMSWRAQARCERPLCLLVLSRMDATVKLNGSYSRRPGAAKHRVDYRAPATLLGDFV